jgi:hypothetical protein
MNTLSGSREGDLRTLKNFSSYDTLGGTCTMQWFYGLLRLYPLEYLQYSHDTPFHLHYRKTAREKLLNGIEWRLSKILNAELTDEKVTTINEIFKQLDHLLDQ